MITLNLTEEAAEVFLAILRDKAKQLAEEAVASTFMASGAEKVARAVAEGVPAWDAEENPVAVMASEHFGKSRIAAAHSRLVCEIIYALENPNKEGAGPANDTAGTTPPET
jgi:hypothetical protein